VGARKTEKEEKKKTLVEDPADAAGAASLPGKGNSHSHGARPVHLIITVIQWIRTSRLALKNSLSGWGVREGGEEEDSC